MAARKKMPRRRTTNSGVRHLKATLLELRSKRPQIPAEHRAGYDLKMQELRDFTDWWTAFCSKLRKLGIFVFHASLAKRRARKK
jgi:hypothetical protein